jgi:hypothetical protein
MTVDQREGGFDSKSPMENAFKMVEEANERYHGRLAAEFGAGSERFFIFPKPLKGERKTDNGRAQDSYLILTTEGYKLLEVQDDVDSLVTEDNFAAAISQSQSARPGERGLLGKYSHGVLYLGGSIIGGKGDVIGSVGTYPSGNGVELVNFEDKDISERIVRVNIEEVTKDDPPPPPEPSSQIAITRSLQEILK